MEARPSEHIVRAFAWRHTRRPRHVRAAWVRCRVCMDPIGPNLRHGGRYLDGPTVRHMGSRSWCCPPACGALPSRSVSRWGC